MVEEPPPSRRKHFPQQSICSIKSDKTNILDLEELQIPNEAKMREHLDDEKLST